MNIAFVSQPWEEVTPTADGGSSLAILTYQLARRLASSGDVLIYARQGPAQPPVYTDADGIRYRRIATDAERWLIKGLNVGERVLGLRHPKRPLFAARSYYAGYARRVARDLQRQPCEIVHIHNFSQFAPIVRAFNPGVKIVLHMHCEWLTQLDRPVIEERLRHVDLVLSCSAFITEKTRRRFPQFAHRCHTLYNGVDGGCAAGEDDTAPARREATTKRLLYVGRVSPEKGVHVLMRAFEHVARHHPEVHLDVVGPPGLTAYTLIVGLSDDPEVARLKRFYGQTLAGRWMRQVVHPRTSYLASVQAALSPDVAGKVSFHGFVPYTRLAEYYRNADVFIFPSVWHEPFGMPIVEAMACGVPVVATRGGGIPELVEDGTTGLLVARGDAEALGEALLHLLEHDDLRTAMGRAGRDRARTHYTWDRAVDALAAFYARLGTRQDAVSEAPHANPEAKQ